MFHSFFNNAKIQYKASRSSQKVDLKTNWLVGTLMSYAHHYQHDHLRQQTLKEPTGEKKTRHANSIQPNLMEPAGCNGLQLG